MSDRLRDLFAVPPEEFVAARDALAKELRAGRREAEAGEVASLRRPTAPIWAVNQLARRSLAEVEELLDSSERVQKAQLRGAAGDELRAAMTAQRAALAKLERGAEQILRGAGLQASPGALRTVQSTLQAAATGSRDQREALRSGTVREALEPMGFEALLGAHPGPARHRPSTSTLASTSTSTSTSHSTSTSTSTSRAAAAAQRAEEREAKRRAQQDAREERKRARDALQLERRLGKLEARAEAAARTAKHARAAADSARSDLDRLRGSTSGHRR
ncbi:MAG TPA: hypothetical protein VKB92_03095 [Myxococcales bacterium]|nr:hypothetical protein [Myxococcales bacterium]